MPWIGSSSAEDFSAHDTKNFISVHRTRAFSEAHIWSSDSFDHHGISKKTTRSLDTEIPSSPCSDNGNALTRTEGFSDTNSLSRYSSPLTSAPESREISPSRVDRDADFLANREAGEPRTSIAADPDSSHSPESIFFPSQFESPADANSGRVSNYSPEHSTHRRGFSTGARYHTPPSVFSDRFISSRNSDQPSSKTFRLSKSPKELTSIERLRRDASSTPDPFTSPSLAHNREGRLILCPTRGRYGGRGRSTSVGGALGSPSDVLTIRNRVASAGAVWNVGGVAATVPSNPIEGIPNGRGGLLSSGSNAPMYTSNFFEEDKSQQDHDYLEARLAVALDIDRTMRLLKIHQSLEFSYTEHFPAGRKRPVPKQEPRTKWINGEWTREGSPSLLDAPHLRDDYYCSVLAYCRASHTLAVGLRNRVYLWSEAYGVEYPRMEETENRRTYVSSLSFSSVEGGQSILAIGRNNGQISLWSLYDSDGTRFRCQQPSPVACVAFKPVVTFRPSQRFGSEVPTEELLVGDEAGIVYYYSIEWMSNQGVDIHGWKGAMNLMAKITVHTQQICGLSWSPNGEFFASGANDNGCCLFDVKDVLSLSSIHDSFIDSEKPHEDHGRIRFEVKGHSSGPPNSGSGKASMPQGSKQEIPGDNGESEEKSGVGRRYQAISDGILYISEGHQKHKWIHSAAVKAIAFCPWQRGLLATGGGSNDRAIHFYHTFSGACLATIDVQAQVTSLIWSTGRREIAATFGYAQPEHPYRIAVFSWPECRQILAIPWPSGQRALFAISYPGGPNKMSRKAFEGEAWGSRTVEEGCIVVACSDESVKFHEVWSGKRKSMAGHMGLLGGSDILESLEGIDKEGFEVIR